MKLLTQEMRQQIPPLYSQEDKGEDVMVVAKFFTPDSSWTWFVLEGGYFTDTGILPLTAPAPEGEDVTFFGLVDGLECEMGYFCLRELETARGPLGLRIGRDLYFKPRKISEIRAEIAARRRRRG